MKPMRPVLAFLLAALCSVLAGCLEAEEVEVRAVAEPAIDRIDLCLLSRGVCARRVPAVPVEGQVCGELEELLRCRDHAAILVPGTEPVDLTQMVKSSDNAERQEDAERIRDRLLEYLEVEPARFFTDADGRLCLLQFARIQRLPAFVAWVNEELRQGRPWEEDRLDPEMEELLATFVERKEDFVAIDGVGIRFRVPCTPVAHEQMRKDLLGDLVHAVGAAAGEADAEEREAQQKSIQTLLDNQLALVRHERHTDVYMGVQGARTGSFWVRRDAEYNGNLLAHLEAKEGKVQPMTEEQLEQAFQDFRKREAREPEAIRQLRKPAAPAGGK